MTATQTATQDRAAADRAIRARRPLARIVTKAATVVAISLLLAAILTQGIGFATGDAIAPNGVALAIGATLGGVIMYSVGAAVVAAVVGRR